MRRIAALALAGWLVQGCFALDEIDAGQRRMDEDSARARSAGSQAAATAADAAEEEGGSWFEGPLRWFREKREARARARAEANRPPDEPIVRCALGDRETFLRESECVLRRGRVL